MSSYENKQNTSCLRKSVTGVFCPLFCSSCRRCSHSSLLYPPSETGKGSEMQACPFANVGNRLAFLAQTRQPFRSRKFESLNTRRDTLMNSHRGFQKATSKTRRIFEYAVAVTIVETRISEIFARIFDFLNNMQAYIYTHTHIYVYNIVRLKYTQTYFRIADAKQLNRNNSSIFPFVLERRNRGTFVLNSRLPSANTLRLSHDKKNDVGIGTGNVFCEACLSSCTGKRQVQLYAAKYIIKTSNSLCGNFKDRAAR